MTRPADGAAVAGDTRECPFCGQPLRFREATRKAGSELDRGSDGSTPLAPVMLRVWLCASAHCGYREPAAPDRFVRLYWRSGRVSVCGLDRQIAPDDTLAPVLGTDGLTHSFVPTGEADPDGFDVYHEEIED